MKVELIFDADCPNVEGTRINLRKAFVEAGLTPSWIEWNRTIGNCPEYAASFGSPTILVDGTDVVPEENPEGNCCRLYPNNSGGIGRVPPIDRITLALKNASKDLTKEVYSTRNWKRLIVPAPSIALAFLPNLACASCWPAYVAIFSALGVGIFDYTPYLLPMTIVALFLTLCSLGWRANQRRGYMPLILAAAAAGSHLIGKFALESSVLSFLGGFGILGAAVWNAWPTHSKSCEI